MSVLATCLRCGSGWGMQIAADGRIVCPKCDHVTETVTSRVHDSGEPLPDRRGDALWFGCLKPPPALERPHMKRWAGKGDTMKLTDYIDTLPEIRHHAEGTLVDAERLHSERGGDFYLCPRFIRDKASRWTYVLLLLDLADGTRARVWVTIESAHPKGRSPFQFEGYVMCRQDEDNRYRFNAEHIVRFMQ